MCYGWDEERERVRISEGINGIYIGVWGRLTIAHPFSRFLFMDILDQHPIQVADQSPHLQPMVPPLLAPIFQATISFFALLTQLIQRRKQRSLT